jgi:hypothetical protein
MFINENGKHRTSNIEQPTSNGGNGNGSFNGQRGDAAGFEVGGEKGFIVRDNLADALFQFQSGVLSPESTVVSSPWPSPRLAGRGEGSAAGQLSLGGLPKFFLTGLRVKG